MNPNTVSPSNAEPDIVDRAAWLAARVDLLEQEKEFTRRRDELAARRRSLPWVEIAEPYVFRTEHGQRSLVELFGDRDQLLLWHFMYGPGWDEGCPSCSFWADGYDGMVPHLAARDTALVVVSRAPLDELLAYRRRMGWSFDWVSSEGTTFNQDFGVSDTTTYNYVELDEPADELPGLSVFIRRGHRVFHTYSAYARGVDQFNAAYAMLDATPLGRHEDDLPWSMAWLRRHDQY